MSSRRALTCPPRSRRAQRSSGESAEGMRSPPARRSRRTRERNSSRPLTRSSRSNSDDYVGFSADLVWGIVLVSVQPILRVEGEFETMDDEEPVEDSEDVMNDLWFKR